MHNNLNTNDEIKENIEDWRNEHGKPSFEYLQSLADTGTQGSLEQLWGIAQDLDISFDPAITPEELIRMIGMEVRENNDSNPIVTN